MEVLIRLENKSVPRFIQPVATSIRVGRLCSVFLLLDQFEFHSKGQIRETLQSDELECQMAASQWKMGVMKKKTWKKNVQIESCIAFSQTVKVSHTRVSRLAPPSGLRGSCVEAILSYVTCLWEETWQQRLLRRHKCPCLQPPHLIQKGCRCNKDLVGTMISRTYSKILKYTKVYNSQNKSLEQSRRFAVT